MTMSMKCKQARRDGRFRLDGDKYLKKGKNIIDARYFVAHEKARFRESALGNAAHLRLPMAGDRDIRDIRHSR